jgi:spermidine synthase
VRSNADVRDMLEQVRAPLLGVLRTSPDFRPAYEPLVGMATALAPLDLAGARQLLAQLMQLQPRWPEAAQALAALPAVP